MNTMKKKEENRERNEHIEAKEQRISINRKKCFVFFLIPKETIK